MKPPIPLFTAAPGKTLAQRVQGLREVLGYSQTRLAEQSNMSLSQIQDIESGLELFLSPAVRQKLCKGLRVRASVLKAVEKPAVNTQPLLSLEARERYMEEILRFPNQTHHCPFCKSELVVRLFHRRDIEDNPLLEVKAHCSKCLFKL